MNLTEIKEKISDNFKVVRDLGTFSSSVFGEATARTMEELFGAGYTSLWIVRNRNHVALYRPKKGFNASSKIIGEKCTNKEFAFALAKRLIDSTNWLNEFINKNNKLELFLKRKKEFVDNYRLFFAYHQAVYSGSNYLHENYPGLKEILKKLDSSYTYNEKVIPDVEKYLVDLNIDYLAHEETEGIIRDMGMFFFNNVKISIFGKELDELEDNINIKEHNDIKELKGIGVSKGKVKGSVKVINNLYNLENIEEGIILVTHMTRPQFNDKIMKCKAIITNEGGILCHAAILAREHGIPCIVGTNIATEILKDGDLIEVDAEKGIVKKL